MTAEQMDNPPERAIPSGKTINQPPAPLEKLIGEIGVAQVGWMNRGACRGLDPNLFFPIYEKDEAVPKEVCSTCPVRIECLEYSLERREDHGIWGGTTEKERRRLRRQRQRTA